MLREPSPVQKVEIVTQVRSGQPKARFRVVKLEERITPQCNINPHGKETGHCKGFGK